MSNHNYMLTDWLAVLAGFGLFSLFAFVPGYALGWLLDILRFRQRSLAFRVALSVPLSIAIGPIFSYLVGRALTLEAVEAVYGIGCIYVLFLGSRELRRGLVPSLRLFIKAQWKILTVVFVWLILAVLMLSDLQIGDRLYYPVIAFDYALRTAFVSAIGTYGVPAQNPFYFPGHPVHLHYHYLWLIQCALLERIAGSWVDARQALIAGTMWCGIGMLCMVPLYLKLFSPLGSVRLYRRTLVGLCLMGIIGLDILPGLLKLWMHFAGSIPGVSPSLEWWNEQVDGWVYTMLWEPHYICSLIACLTAFLILWQAPGENSRTRRMISAAIAGLALATAVGAGIYVAFVFAVFLVFWTAVAFLNRKGPEFSASETQVLVVAGVVALIAALPFLLELRGGGGAISGAAGGGGGTEFPIRFTIRAFELLDLDRLFGAHWKTLVANVVLLPLNYFLELGFFFAVGWLVWKTFRAQKRVPGRQEWAAFAMAGTSITICTFMKSSLIANNDLGWRGFLPAQFILLLWAADLFRGRETAPADGSTTKHLITPPLRFHDKPVMVVLILLGAAGTSYDLALLRFYPLWSDQGKLPKIFWMSDDNRLGKRTYAARQAYQWLNAHTPPRSIIQQNPDLQFQDTLYGLYGNRQTVVEDRTCSSVFSGARGECKPIVASLTGLFGKGASTRNFRDVCAQLPIDIAVAKDTDAAWRDPSSWVWTRQPIFANDFFRLFPCER